MLLPSEDTYLTLKGESEGLFKEKGSKFFAFAFPVQDEEEVKEKLEQLRKKYYDARHHCYAYILGKKQETYRANDDGEPNHSAGDPILGQIRSNHLTHVLIVVVRYFGGIKLGVGGLITAYKSAAAEAISNNQIVTSIVKHEISIHFDYLAMNEVMKIIKEADLEIKQQHFDNSCSMVLKVREKILGETMGKFEEIKGVGSIKKII
jgi:uncharacterized YigZ family protein